MIDRDHALPITRQAHLLGHEPAHMGVPIIVSRNGVTAMGHQLATRLGMTLFGRAANRHFLCYAGFDRFDSEARPRGTPMPVIAG